MPVRIENIFLATGSFIPDTDGAYDLGSSTKQFKDLYVDGKAYIDELGENLNLGSKELSSGTLNALVLKGTFTASDTVTLPAITLGGTLTLNSQIFDAGSNYLEVKTTGNNTAFFTATNDGIYGATFVGTHISTTPAVNDRIFTFAADGRDLDSPQNAVTYANLSFRIEDASAGVADGKMTLRLARNGSLVDALNISSIGVLNPDHSIMFNNSYDSVAVANKVSLGGYDISAGHRALAISSEEVVVTEAVGASDRSYPIRINGATYKMMLVAV